MPVADFTPTVDEVASLITSRTFVKGTLAGSDNNLAGTFTDETRPTKEQAEGLIDQAVLEITPRVIDNDDTSASVYGLAKMAVARRTALLILFSFYEEELEDANGGYDELLQLYKDALAALEGIQDDTGASARGIYSIPMRSEADGAYCAPDLLP